MNENIVISDALQMRKLTELEKEFLKGTEIDEFSELYDDEKLEKIFNSNICNALIDIYEEEVLGFPFEIGMKLSRGITKADKDKKSVKKALDSLNISEKYKLSSEDEEYIKYVVISAVCIRVGDPLPEKIKNRQNGKNK